LAAHTVPDAPQVLPAQHGWPAPPQAAQTFRWHTVPASVQVWSPQQTLPVAPHALQVPAAPPMAPVQTVSAAVQKFAPPPAAGAQHG
jgi:hypothetical protein